MGRTIGIGADGKPAEIKYVKARKPLWFVINELEVLRERMTKVDYGDTPLEKRADYNNCIDDLHLLIDQRINLLWELADEQDQNNPYTYPKKDSQS